MRAKLTTLLLPAVFVLAAACGSDATGPESTNVSGTWTGSSSGITLSVTLSEGSDGSLSGSGNISGGTESFALTVSSGTHAGSTVSFTMESAGFRDLNYAGTLQSPTSMSGSLNGSGFNNTNLNLTKQ